MPPSRSLQGVVVLDLSRLLPGPLCSWYLQGLGARVIRVDDPRPEGGDWARHMPPWTPEGVGAWYAAINAGKESIALDLSRAEGRDALLALLPHVDVLIEGFRPGTMGRLGLAPDGLLERFPHLVIASLSGFGQDGPLRDLPGHDLGYAGLTGALALGARHDGVPDPPALQLADVAGGSLTGALSIVAALFARQRTGRGRWLDVSLTDGLLALMGPHIAATVSGSPPRPGGEALTGGLAVYRVYRCADGGLVAVAALEAKFQDALRAGLAAELGREVALTADELAAAFRTRPRDHWTEKLGHACVTPVLEVPEVPDHPLHRARRSVVGEGAGRRVRPPFPGADREAAMPPPAPGQDTERILAEFGVAAPEQS